MSLTTPNGGTINYVYGEQGFHLGSTVVQRTRSVTERPTGGRRITAAKAVALNITIVDPTAPGYRTLYPVGATPPITSNLNYSTGAARSNNTVLILSGGQAYCNQASGTAQLTIDVAGSFQ